MTKQILLVDDEPHNLDILRIFLKSLKYEVVEAKCGMEALQVIENSKSLDLILLDVMMPDISGLEICERINRLSDFDIPIIFLSAKAQKEDILLGLQAGAIDYLTKPFDLDLLERKISIALQHREKVGDLQQINSRLTTIAFKDGLTHLYNRSYLNKIKEEIERGLVHYDSILLIDIDCFKQINDVYGHLGGDKVLSQLAEIIISNINTAEDIAIRYGGDEFLVLLQHSSVDRSNRTADLIHSQISSAGCVLEKCQKNPVSVCIGVSTRMKNESFESMFSRADHALFEAKHWGRNQIQIAKEI